MNKKIKLLTPEEAKQIKSESWHWSYEVTSGPCAAVEPCSAKNETVACSGVEGESCIKVWREFPNGSEIKHTLAGVICGKENAYRTDACKDSGSESDSGVDLSSGFPGDPVSACSGLSDNAPCIWYNGSTVFRGKCMTVQSRSYCVTGARGNKSKL